MGSVVEEYIDYVVQESRLPDSLLEQSHATEIEEIEMDG